MTRDGTLSEINDLRIKDGQKFVTIEGFKEDKVDSVQLNMMTFVLVRHSKTAQIMASRINNQASYETR